MSLLFDLFPAMIFFVLYHFKNIYVATAGLIIVTALQCAYTLVRYRRIDGLQAIVFLLILIFGSATIWFHDPKFLQWKVSIAGLVMSAAFFLFQRFSKESLLQRMMKDSVTLPKSAWKKLNDAWTFFFLGIAIINAVIAKYFSLSFWVDFKVFGIIGLTLVFVLIQAIYIQRNSKN